MVLWWLSSFIFFWLILTSNYWLKTESMMFLGAISSGLMEFISASFWEARSYFVIFSPILFLLLIALFNLLFRYRFLNYHIRIQRSFFALSLFLLLSMLFVDRVSFFSFYYLSIPIAYFLSQFYLELRRSAWNEFIFSGLFVLGISLNVALITNSIIFSNLPDEQRSYSISSPEYSDKKVMVFGEPAKYLKGNLLAGPFLDWKYSEARLAEMDPKRFISFMHGVFEKDPPDRIIDHKGEMSRIFSSDPIIRSKYYRDGDGIYSRK